MIVNWSSLVQKYRYFAALCALLPMACTKRDAGQESAEVSAVVTASGGPLGTTNSGMGSATTGGAAASASTGLGANATSGASETTVTNASGSTATATSGMAVGGAGGGTSAGSIGGSTGIGGTGDGSGAMPWMPDFETTVLGSDFVSEGADVADIDGDGALDLVLGPHWYRGPDFQFGGELFDVPQLTRDQYSTFFLTFVDDLNGDSYPDVLAIGDAGGGNGSGNPNSHWYENPGPGGLDQPWAKHVLFDGLVSNESPHYVDLVDDARRELVFMTDGQLGYATPSSSATDPWVFTPISGDVFNTPYVHGLGVGDVNADGLMDVVESTGWWEQPVGASTWTHHAVDFAQGSRGGAQMLVFDVDGDSDADVVTSLNAHGYGLSWFEQQNTSFAHHQILPATASGDSFSQIHALAAADLNGDALLDIVTGKRYYAHPSTNPDPGTTDPPVLYWFELSRGDDGAAFTPHLIHDASGVGCNFTIADTNQDGRPDIVVSNKHGSFLHRQL